MADAQRPGFFSFISMPTPTHPGGGYQTGATMLKVIGWIRLVTLALGTLFGLLVLLLAIAFQAVLIAILEENASTAPIAGMGIALILVFVAIFLVLFVGIGLAFLYWTSWCYAKWAGQVPGSVGGIKAFAIVTIILSAFGSLAVLSGDVTSLPSVALLVCSIILLTKLNDHEVQAAVGHRAPDAQPPVN